MTDTKSMKTSRFEAAMADPAKAAELKEPMTEADVNRYLEHMEDGLRKKLLARGMIGKPTMGGRLAARLSVDKFDLELFADLDEDRESRLFVESDDMPPALLPVAERIGEELNDILPRLDAYFAESLNALGLEDPDPTTMPPAVRSLLLRVAGVASDAAELLSWIERLKKAANTGAYIQ